MEKLFMAINNNLEKMIIKKNTICYTSEVGYNNFFYPTQNKVLVKDDCEAITLTWIGSNNKIPIKILKSNLIPLNMTGNTTENTSPPMKDKFTVVWITK